MIGSPLTSFCHSEVWQSERQRANSQQNTGQADRFGSLLSSPPLQGFLPSPTPMKERHEMVAMSPADSNLMFSLPHSPSHPQKAFELLSKQESVEDMLASTFSPSIFSPPEKRTLTRGKIDGASSSMYIDSPDIFNLDDSRDDKPDEGLSLHNEHENDDDVSTILDSDDPFDLGNTPLKTESPMKISLKFTKLNMKKAKVESKPLLVLAEQTKVKKGSKSTNTSNVNTNGAVNNKQHLVTPDTHSSSAATSAATSSSFLSPLQQQQLSRKLSMNSVNSSNSAKTKRPPRPTRDTHPAANNSNAMHKDQRMDYDGRDEDDDEENNNNNISNNNNKNHKNNKYNNNGRKNMQMAQDDEDDEEEEDDDEEGEEEDESQSGSDSHRHNNDDDSDTSSDNSSNNVHHHNNHNNHNTNSKQKKNTATNALHSNAPASKTAVSCNCKKSKCLKLYCDCFAILRYCDPTLCRCVACSNTVSHEHVRNNAIRAIKERNSRAFRLKINEDEQQHVSGCHCKNSRCLKKYCECFTAMALCGNNCKCLSCDNYSGSEELLKVRKQQGVSVVVTQFGGGGGVSHNVSPTTSNTSSLSPHLPNNDNNSSSSAAATASASAANNSNNNNNNNSNSNSRKRKDSPNSVAALMENSPALRSHSANSSSSSGGNKRQMLSSTPSSVAAIAAHLIHTPSPNNNTATSGTNTSGNHNNSISTRSSAQHNNNHSHSHSSSSSKQSAPLSQLERHQQQQLLQLKQQKQQQQQQQVGNNNNSNNSTIRQKNTTTTSTSTSTSTHNSSNSNNNKLKSTAAPQHNHHNHHSSNSSSNSLSVTSSPGDCSVSSSLSNYNNNNHNSNHNNHSNNNNSSNNSSSRTRAKNKKVRFATTAPVTYPFFGPSLPNTTKFIALKCLDYLSCGDLYTMSTVNSLWCSAATDEALWE